MRSHFSINNKSLVQHHAVLLGGSIALLSNCVCVCCHPVYILDVRLLQVPAGITQGEGHTRFLHLPFAVLAFIFLAGRIQPFLSLVDREVEFCGAQTSYW